jgi:uncharacterized protein with GYD domain
MPKYLVQASYTGEGLKGVRKDKASGRKAAVSKAVEALGGKLESFYFAFGEDDVVAILDMPDNASVAAFSMASSASGVVRTRTTLLMTIEEADKALATNVSFRAPGQ